MWTFPTISMKVENMAGMLRGYLLENKMKNKGAEAYYMLRKLILEYSDCVMAILCILE